MKSKSQIKKQLLALTFCTLLISYLFATETPSLLKKTKTLAQGQAELASNQIFDSEKPSTVQFEHKNIQHSRQPSTNTLNCNFSKTGTVNYDNLAKRYIYFYAALYLNPHAKKHCPDILQTLTSRGNFMADLSPEHGEGDDSGITTIWFSDINQIEILKTINWVDKTSYKDQGADQSVVVEDNFLDVFFRVKADPASNRGTPPPILKMVLKLSLQTPGNCASYDFNKPIRRGRESQQGVYEEGPTSHLYDVKLTQCWPRN
jgi:hypothetical protein